MQIDMPLWHALLLGILEGFTEFLPISSTAHLTIAEKLLGYQIDNPDVTAFTAIIQVGAVVATLLYLRKDLFKLISAFLAGVFRGRRNDPFYRRAWAVIIGSIPIGIIGFLFQDTVQTTLRSLWVIAFALIAWSFVMLYADRKGKQTRPAEDVNNNDTLIIGIVQSLSLIPGVSRSGATMSAGLLRDIDRVEVTKLSFLLSIPALVAASILQSITKASDISNGVGWGPTLLAMAVSFVVAYGAVAGLLRFIAKHNYVSFIIYRIALGALLIVLLSTGAIAAT